MASATVLVSVGATPVANVADGIEVMECMAQIPGSDPVDLVLRARSGTKGADLLKQTNTNDHLLVSGVITLDEAGTILTAGVICSATDQQFFNEIVLVGNLAREGTPSESGKSLRRSMAVDKVRRDPSGEFQTETDWFMVRANQGKNPSSGTTMMDRLGNAAKGSMVQINGMLIQRLNKQQKPYVEVLARKLKVHKRGGTGSRPDPAAGLKVAGYEPEAFHEDDDMPANW